ncbi:hypothetical protein [Streptomyces fulvoviolaceus]|uniref:hypothetical protein n=1 Tax=Streptomyces fulvoviolaceus TaxID=285535 RepID=UPI0004CA9A95|nr:hypothetical protein [Streptomyces fulvoviolaceus]MCT9077145.1 hypothetical protein [Streptomyces fulvoviolaceus]
MHTRRFAASLSVLCATVALSAVAGCSSSSGSGEEGKAAGGTGAPSVSSFPKLTSATDKSLPVEAYLLTTEQEDQMADAEKILRERCMTRFGIAYKVPEAPSVFAPTSITQLRYGPTDADDVAGHGYKPAGSENAVVKPKPEELAPAATMVLNGTTDPNVKPGSAAAKGGQDYNGQKVPAGGCIGEAKAKLGYSAAQEPSEDGAPPIADKVNTDSWAKSYEDTRVKAVFAKWASCMKEKGYTYADPMKANNDPQWEQNALATAKEKQVASADVACKVKYNVVGTWYAVDVAYQEQLIEQNAEALAEVKKTKDKQLKLMAEVL